MRLLNNKIFAVGRTGTPACFITERYELITLRYVSSDVVIELKLDRISGYIDINTKHDE